MGLSRRNFLTGSLALGGAAALGSLWGCTPQQESPEKADSNAGAGTADWLGEEVVIDEASISKTIDTEMLVIGAGMAGLLGAAVAADAGADVIVLERMPSVCEARRWMGAANTPWQEEYGLKVDPADFKNEILRESAGRIKTALVDVWLKESGDALSFVQETIGNTYGHEIVLQGDVPADKTHYIPPIQHNLQPVNMSEEDFLFDLEDQNQLFEKYLNEKGAEIMLETPMVKLEKNENAVVGAIAQDKDGNYIRIHASKGVLLATGGYINNPDMMLALQPEAIAVSNGAFISFGSLGDGIKAGLWAGGIIRDLPTTMIQNRSMVHPGTKSGYIKGSPGSFPSVMQWTFGTQPFMAVNQFGKRFINEYTPNDYIVNACGKYPNGTWCQIFDSSWPEDTKQFHTTGCSRMYPSEFPSRLFVNSEEMTAADLEKYVSEGVIAKADTLEDLAEQLMIPADVFVEEVKRYNELVDEGYDSDFGKAKICLSKLDEPPYYGVTLGGMLNTTLDGLDINEDMQVLDAEGEPIEGLWAAGDVAGGFFNGCYPWHLVGIASGRTVTFGWHAARNMLGLD